MANRYWVGGTGTWNGTSTTNWSATSGGSGGASVPSTSDNVFFDANSGGGTVTISSSGIPTCNDLNYSGYTGTYVGSSYRITVRGDFTSGSTATFSNARFGFTPTATTVSVNFSGANGTFDEIYPTPGAGKTVNITSNVTCDTFTTFGSGTVNTNNNDFDVAGFKLADTTITVNTGTSTISCTSFTLTSGGANLPTASTTNITNNLPRSTTFDLFLAGNTFDGSVVLTNGVTLRNRNTGTINNLTVNTTTATTVFTLWADLTVSSLLTIVDSGAGTITVNTVTPGTQQTLSAGSTSLSNIRWQDINAAGAGSPFTGVGFIDLGNNTNIIFPVTANGLFFGSNF